MTFSDILLLLFGGIVAGVANTLAGGGSLLAVPLLVFLGYSPTVANATTRPGILVQCLLAFRGLRHVGLSNERLDLRGGVVLGLCAVPGAVAGAFLATEITDDTLRRLLAVVMVGVLAWTWWSRGRGGFESSLRVDRPGLVAMLFVGVGLYGGFIQAGVGFVMTAILMNATRLDLVAVNARKIVVVAVYSVVAIIVFVAAGLVAWAPAAVLIVAQGIGGYVGGRLIGRLSERTLLTIYSVLLIVFAVALLF